ncbi:hypothetical protein K501DRAFT_237975 [Backusella circina FSU 941]|nr:hypothetical protein K501DRAFT_237975 [Backusella circina FSU 941]
MDTILKDKNFSQNVLNRRKSDSNLVMATAQKPRRTSQLTPLNKVMLSDHQKKDQEDTFYNALEISFHHSVGSMSISPACRDVVLAGRQGLVIIDLENPWLPPRILPHMSKWEVADVQWSPHVSRESWVASTSNQKLLVWNLNLSGEKAIEHVFHAHARAISDINWSPYHPDLLATCSVDTYVHLWDLRESNSSDDDRTMRPSCSFTPWNAAATQVKFNRKSEYLIASAHDKDVQIWDIRKGAVPVTTITAHSKKIYGIDWSRTNDHDIVTCSLDKLVKFWNIHTPEKEEEVIVTDTPIWRARNTPFGNGVLIMPQRTESKLSLYNRDSPELPVHAFEGHKDTVKEFVWRWKGDINGPNGDDREFQLVTWSKDQNLRLWPISDDIAKSIRHPPNKTKTKLSTPASASRPFHRHSFQQEPLEKNSSDIRFAPAPLRTASGSDAMTPYRSSNVPAAGYEQSNAFKEQKYSSINPLLWMQNVKTVGPAGGDLRRDATAEYTYQSVAEEMSTVLNKYIPVGVKTEKINAASRTCTISLHGPWSDTGDALLRITIRFSQQYPDKSPPEFDLQKNSMISIYYRAHMQQDLNTLASSFTSQGKWCLEPCIRYLLGENIQEESEHPNSIDSSTGLTQSTSHWKGNMDDSDDELAWGPLHGKRPSVASEGGIMVDMSGKQSTDERVPFPRLCGGVFSGSGQLVCFFSTLRVRDTNRSVKKTEIQIENQARSDRSNGEYFENTYSDYDRHPKTYDQFEEYKEIAAMSRQGKNATVLVGGTGGAFGGYVHDDDQDDIDDGLAAIDDVVPMFFKTESMAIGSTLGNNDNLLYHSTKTDRITHKVVIADFSDKMPYSPWLAKEYILSTKDNVGACIHNAKVCRKYGRFDLYKVWCLAVEILQGCVPADIPEPDRLVTDGHQLLVDHVNAKKYIMDKHWQRDKKLAEVRALLLTNEAGGKQVEVAKPLQKVKWGMHPLGQKLVDDLIQHFVHTGDVQTAAMLSCIFHVRTRKLPPPLFGQKSLNLDRTPEGVELDYFSLKTNHRFNLTSQHYQQQQQQQRPRSGGAIGESNSVDNTHTKSTMSTSYGGKSNILSYLWEYDKKTSPNDHTPDSLQSPKRSNSRLNRSFTMHHRLNLKIPSNTAPGVRHVASSFDSSSVASPATLQQQPTPTTPLFSKEGKVIDTAEMSLEFTNMDHFDSERFFQTNRIPLLDKRNTAQRDVLRLVYADLLYRWHLLDQRAEVLQFLVQSPFPDKELVSQHLQVPCFVCGTEIANLEKYCVNCRKMRKSIKCSFCHVLVRGLVNFCYHCGHGGHSDHMRHWFVDSKQVYCMTGCGCKCALESLHL